MGATSRQSGVDGALRVTIVVVEKIWDLARGDGDLSGDDSLNPTPALTRRVK